MKDHSAVSKPTVQFEINRVYDRKAEIHGPFGGSRQSGIAPSNVADAIFIFTGPSGAQFGYEDSETVDEDGGTTFLYTGEGQTGDMQFIRGNRAILEHSRDGRALHLFRTVGKKERASATWVSLSTRITKLLMAKTVKRKSRGHQVTSLIVVIGLSTRRNGPKRGHFY